MIPFKTNCNPSQAMVSPEVMQRVYEEIKTPYKWGAVIKNKNKQTDCPTLFKKDGMWYMMYVVIDPASEFQGYDTYLATSSDLLTWEQKGKVLSRGGSGWDCCQKNG